MTDTNTTREAVERDVRYWSDWADDVERMNGAGSDVANMRRMMATLRALLDRAETAESDKAAAVAAALEAVKIKPLVWFEAQLPSRGGGKYTAEGYTIRKIEGLWLLDFAGGGSQEWQFLDLEGAQSAAQADYERRIREAMEPPTPDQAEALAAVKAEAEAKGRREGSEGRDMLLATTAYEIGANAAKDGIRHRDPRVILSLVRTAMIGEINHD